MLLIMNRHAVFIHTVFKYTTKVKVMVNNVVIISNSDHKKLDCKTAQGIKTNYKKKMTQNLMRVQFIA